MNIYGKITTNHVKKGIVSDTGYVNCFESDQVCEVCRFRYPVARLLFVSQNALNVVLVRLSLKVDCLETFEVRRKKSEGF